VQQLSRSVALRRELLSRRESVIDDPASCRSRPSLWSGLNAASYDFPLTRPNALRRRDLAGQVRRDTLQHDLYKSAANVG
jgi:hypothetical protein